MSTNGMRRILRLGTAAAFITASLLAVAIPGGASAVTALPAGTATQLQGLAVQEKYAHDAYLAFRDVGVLPIYDNLGESEARHLSTVRELLAKHGIEDVTAGDADGAFDDPAVQSAFSAAVQAGRASAFAALTQGATIERTLLATLDRLLASDAPKDVRQVATNLRDATANHLAAVQQVLATTPPAGDPTATAARIVQTAEIQARVSGRYRVGDVLVLAPRPVKTDAGVTVRWRVTKETRATCTVRTVAGATTVRLREPGRCVVIGYAPAPSAEYTPFRITRTYRVLPAA